MNNQFAATAVARDAALQEKIRRQLNQASIRYVFAPIYPMIMELLSTTIDPGQIVPISEQGQPVGEVYLQTLVRDGEIFDPDAYDVKGGIGEIAVNPAPIVDELLSQYGPQGAVQIKTLYNLEVGSFLAYGLNELIFEGKAYETAQAYRDQFARVRTPEYLEEFARSHNKAWPPDFGQLLGRVLFELEACVNLTLAWATTKAQWSNQALKSGDLKKFSPFEHKVFKFSGVTPHDEAMNQVALNQASLAHQLPNVITEFKEAVIASKPDYSGLGAAIAEGVTAGVKEAMAAMQNQPAPAAAPAAAPAKEEPKPANNKSGNRS